MRYLRFGIQNDYHRWLFFKPLFEKVSTDAERGNHESNRNPYQTFAGLRRVSLKLLINVPAWKNSKTNRQKMNFGNFRPMNGPKSWNRFPNWTIPSKTGKTLPTIRKNWRPQQNSTGKKRILNCWKKSYPIAMIWKKAWIPWKSWASSVVIMMTEMQSLPFTQGREERSPQTVSYTHLRAHETGAYLVCRLLLEKKKTI